MGYCYDRQNGQDIVGGLAVVSLHGKGAAWEVIHAASNLPVFGGGFLRQKRFAVEARADFLATGIDFTLSAALLRGKLGPMGAVRALWMRRSMQDKIDLRTGEHYSWSTHYGQVIPSAQHAKRLAAALESYVWS
jgi:hypothetical protein